MGNSLRFGKAGSNPAGGNLLLKLYLHYEAIQK